MSVTFTTCTACQGAKRRVILWPQVALSPDETPILTQQDPADVESFEIVTCSCCNGLKGPDDQTYARYRDAWSTYGEPYKSASTLKAALTRGKATVCKQCEGHGRTAKIALIGDCYTCHGMGQQLTGFAAGDSIPPSVNLYNHAPLRAWVESVEWHVMGGQQTWNEAYLGLGTVSSVTDYGRLLDIGRAAYQDGGVPAATEAMLTHVKGTLAGESTQLIHICDKATRQAGTRAILKVSRNGYTVFTTASLDGAHDVMLPPAYTDEALNRPVE